MDLYRKIEDRLLNWKNQTRNVALLVTGPRDIGKTYTLSKFCKNNFMHFNYLNVRDIPDAKYLLNNAVGYQEFISVIELLIKTKLQDEMVIFLDEIQILDNPLSVMKQIVESTNTRFILSGSLLGVDFLKRVQLPLGDYLTEIRMYPLDFEEFLIARGYRQLDFELLKECYDKKRPVDSDLHKKLLKELYLYLVLGGMPSVVSVYLDTFDLSPARIKLQEAVYAYEYDIVKYSDINDRFSIINIFHAICSELCNNSSRFYLSNLQKGARLRDYNTLFSWLIESGAAYHCSSVSVPVIPISKNTGRIAFKLYHHDVGFFSRIFEIYQVLKIVEGESKFNLGPLYQNFVACELRAHGSPLYYYNNKKAGEVDFLTVSNKTILPIEVKSGKDYYVHSALKNLLNNESLGIKEAVVLTKGNVEVKDNITYYPIYMVMFMQEFD
jgi:predicted AAA+ superfamily ATPase